MTAGVGGLNGPVDNKTERCVFLSPSRRSVGKRRRREAEGGSHDSRVVRMGTGS